MLNNVTSAFGYMEATRDLDKKSFGIEVGTEAWLERVQERLEGEEVGTMSIVWEKLRFFLLKKKDSLISIS